MHVDVRWLVAAMATLVGCGESAPSETSSGDGGDATTTSGDSTGSASIGSGGASSATSGSMSGPGTSSSAQSGSGGAGPCTSGQSSCEGGVYQICVASVWHSVACANGCDAQAALCLPGTQPGASWPMYQGGPEHRNMLSNIGPASAGPATSILVPPGVDGDTLPLDGMAVAADGTIYVTSQGNYQYATLTAIAQNGSILWQRPHALGTPVIGADGTVYVLGGLTLDAVKPGDGSTKWAKTLPVPVTPSALGPDGTIYALDLGYQDPEKLRTVHPDGSPGWEFPLPSYDGFLATGLVVAPDGTIFLTNSGADRAAVRPDGTALWSVDWPSAVLDVSPLSLGPDGTLYHIVDGALYAIHPADGSQAWNVGTDLEWSEAPTVGSDGTIYLTGTGYGPMSMEYIVEAFHPDGTRWWKYLLDESATTTPVVDAQGALYIASSGCNYSFGNWACNSGATGTLYRFDVQPPGNDVVAAPSWTMALPSTARYGSLAFRGNQLLVPVDPRSVVVVGM